MRYLVTTREGPAFFSDQEMAEALENAVIPGLDTLAGLEKAGTITGGLPVGGRSLAFVAEAASSDELDKMLRALSMWGALEWEVTPLQDFAARADMERAVVADLKKGG